MRHQTKSGASKRRARVTHPRVLARIFATVAIAISFGFGNLTSLISPAVAAETPAVPSVTVGAQSHVVDGVNVERGTNQLILYTRTSSQTCTPTNIYGAEVVVVSSRVTIINDRLITHGGCTPIPTGAVVLSGHDLAREWLLANARIGASVTLPPDTVTTTAPASTTAPPSTTNRPPSTTSRPSTTTPPSTSGFPAQAVGVYNLMWPNSPGPLSGEPSGINVHFLAFGASDSSGTINLMGYGPTGKADLLSALAADRAAGDKVILSLGGSGYSVNLSSTAARVADIARIAADVGGLDGVDIDIENGSIDQTQIVAFAQGLRTRFGAGFAFTMAPNGSNIDTYLPVAKALSDRGLLTQIGQQFYEAPVSLGAAKGRIQQLVDGGIPQSQIAVGMMVDAAGGNYWTLQQCRDNMANIKATWPGITKAYLWEASRSGTSTWVSDMRSIFGI